MTKTISNLLLKEVLARHGFGLIGWTPAAMHQKGAAALTKWQELQLHGTMRYMGRPAELLSDPRQLLNEAATVVMLAVPYSAESAQDIPMLHGRIARYAWGLDYHAVIRARLSSAINELEKVIGFSLALKAFSDAVPLLERAFAVEAGLGFVGKNTLVIRPRVGSYFFLADLLLGCEISQPSLTVVREDQSCGKCHQCREACPTAALETPYRLDARRCVSYLSIEKRGMLDPWERRALGAWLFGCDRCQEVCPFNSLAGAGDGEHGQWLAPWPELQSTAGIGKSLPLSEVLRLRTTSEFKKIFQNTALMRAGRAQLLRNAACLTVNLRAEELVGSLSTAVLEDASPIVRATATWALAELASTATGATVRSIRSILGGALRDSDEAVRYEAQLWHEHSSATFSPL